MNILIVEDDKMLGMYLNHELQLSGHTVTIAADGIKGLQYCSDQIFDLCIVDILLPGNNGFEVLNTIQNIWQMNMTIFVMSQLKDAERMLSNNNIKYDCFFQKPIDILKLFQRIELLMMI